VAAAGVIRTNGTKNMDVQQIGVVTDRDIVCRTVAEGTNPLELTARSCLSAPAVTVTPETSVDECCRVME
jgi:CBS domain-containing protein